MGNSRVRLLRNGKSNGMLNFDEVYLVNRLAKMDTTKRVAFAAACATRLLPLFEQYAVNFFSEGSETIRKALNLVWRSVTEGIWNHEIINNLIENVMDIMPEEDIEWTPLHAYAEDATASTAYTLRALISNNPREAGWAARRSYETVDLAAQKIIDFKPDKKDSEIQLLSHPLIQQELQRQKQDLADLESNEFTKDTFTKIKERAFSHPIVTGE